MKVCIVCNYKSTLPLNDPEYVNCPRCLNTGFEPIPKEEMDKINAEKPWEESTEDVNADRLCSFLEHLGVKVPLHTWEAIKNKLRGTLAATRQLERERCATFVETYPIYGKSLTADSYRQMFKIVARKIREGE